MSSARSELTAVAGMGSGRGSRRRRPGVLGVALASALVLWLASPVPGQILDWHGIGKLLPTLGSHPLLTHPRYPDVVYLGSTGEVSRDGGFTWEDIPAFVNRRAELSPDPWNPEVVYSISRVPYGAENATRKVVRAQVGRDDVTMLADGSTFQDVPAALAVPVNGPERLLVETLHGDVWTTTDAGAHWEQVLESNPASIPEYHFLVTGHDGSVFVPDDEESTVLLRAPPGLSTWERIVIEPGWEVLDVVASAHSPRMFAYLFEGRGAAPDRLPWDAVYRSDDGGSTWRRVLRREVGLGGTRGSLALDRTDDDRIAWPHGREVYWSDDGGESWNVKVLPASAMREYLADSVAFVGSVTSRLFVTAHDFIAFLDAATGVSPRTWGSIKAGQR